MSYWDLADSPEIVQAERELDDLIAIGYDDLNVAREALTKFSEHHEKPLTDAEVDALRQYATGPHASKEWELVAELVARAELTWREVAEADPAPAVLAAVDAEALTRLDPSNPLDGQPAATQADRDTRGWPRTAGAHPSRDHRAGSGSTFLS